MISNLPYCSGVLFSASVARRPQILNVPYPGTAAAPEPSSALKLTVNACKRDPFDEVPKACEALTPLERAETIKARAMKTLALSPTRTKSF